jgi:hypothetical protein
MDVRERREKLVFIFFYLREIKFLSSKVNNARDFHCQVIRYVFVMIFSLNQAFP